MTAIEETAGQIPKHIGFIMDGNRHWAKEHAVSLEDGYRAGEAALIATISACKKAGIGYMTVYAFSNENWRRPEKQKNLLMRLFEKSYISNKDELLRLGARVNFVGRLTDFPMDVQLSFKAIEKATRDCRGIVLNVAASYGGHAEIVDATKKIIADGLQPEVITEEKFAEYIYEAGMPNPDLIVRTSGEKRLSGFLLWQSDYAELYFTDKNWPDFDAAELEKALAYYNNAKRNFGK